MNTRKPNQPTCDNFCNTPFYRNKFRGLLLLAASLLAAWTWSGNLAQAANILTNPGFEADGNHGPGVPIEGWTPPGSAWYINSDEYAHSGNNYYKVWGTYSGSPNYQAVYQDNSSLPTSTYQADGWLFTLPTDVLWSGDDADYAWLEVTFRDANTNILALYRSDLFSDTLGSVPYTTGIWYDFTITNICETNPPYTTIGHTNVLVAPPGTVFVRFQHTLYQALYGGGSCYFDDATLNQTGGPVPPQVTQIYPGNLLFASNHISFNIYSPSSTPISNGNIHLVVNGMDVSGSCSYSGSSPNIGVTYTGLTAGTWAYTASITVTDSVGFTGSATMNFDTINPSYVWEAEDYDFTNGMFYDNPVLSSTPQPDSYFMVTGVTNVDYQRLAGPSGQNATYRTNDWTGIGIAGDAARQNYLTAQLTNPSVEDWNVGYINIGDWLNYTHHYPAGTYNIYGRLAGGDGATTVALSNVVSGTLVGNFQFNGTDWGAYQYVPLVDSNDNVLPITFNGSQQTLSVTLMSGGDNMNFFMLVPASVGLPLLSNIAPTNGTVFATNSTFSFTTTSTSTINNSGIQLILNGANVSSSLVISGSSTKNVSFPLLQSNTLYTAVINVTNASGAGVSRTVQFDTMSTANFYVKIEDFDFNGGQYDTVGNGLIPNAYEGDGLPGDTGAVSNVDYFHQISDGGNYLYRGPNALATEITSDIPLPGYTAGLDYDVGNFNNGNWGNFTRNYPAGKYYVYGRLAGVGGMDTALGQVTSGLGTTSQTINTLGTWVANPNGWQTWVWVQLQNNGVPVIVSVGGVNTLRVTSAGNCNANYFMLVPVRGIHISAAQSGGNTVISFPTTAGSTYRVFYSTSLTSGSWTQLATVPGNGTVESASDATSGGSMRFYKVTSP